MCVFSVYKIFKSLTFKSHFANRAYNNFLLESDNKIHLAGTYLITHRKGSEPNQIKSQLPHFNFSVTIPCSHLTLTINKINHVKEMPYLYWKRHSAPQKVALAGWRCRGWACLWWWSFAPCCTCRSCQCSSPTDSGWFSPHWNLKNTSQHLF